MVIRKMSASSKRLHALAVCACLCVAFGFMESRLLAQGTSGTLPDPISTRDLMNYAKRLKLSDQQRRAAEAAHDQYKEEFRTLREGEIASFLNDVRKMQGTMPKRADFDTMLKKIEQLNSRIAAVDNRMFDNLAAALTDEQMAMLPRVRQDRQRARLKSQDILAMAGQRSVDLSEMLQDSPLSPEEVASADFVLISYESKLTSLQSKLYETSLSTWTSMFDAMENAGLSEESFSNPEEMERFGKVMQEAWGAIMRKSMELAVEIHELNKRTYRSITASLQPDSARWLRERYYSQQYPELGFALRGNDPFEPALKSEELAPEQREAVAAAQADFRTKLDRLIEEATSLIDKSRQEFSPFDFNSEKMQEHNQKLSELYAKGHELQTESQKTLVSIVGAEAAGKFALKTGVPAVVRAPAPEESVDDESDDEHSSEHAQHIVGDMFVPPPLSKGELNTYMKRMSVSDEQRPVIQHLFSAYQEQIQTIKQQEIAALTRASQNMWKFDEATHTTTPASSEAIQELHNRRLAAVQAILKADAEFFEDVAISIDQHQEPALKSVRLAREREVYNRGGRMGWWMGGSEESSIDLALLVIAQKLPPDQSQTLEALLGAYEESITPTFRERFMVRLENQLAQDRFNAELIKAQNEGNVMATAVRHQELMADATRRLGEVNRRINEVNRAKLQEVMQKLPADAAKSLREAYNRKAYPNVYNDSQSVDSHLDRALKLPSLSESQRSSLSELALEYRSTYVQLSEQMVKQSADSDTGSWPTGFDAEAARTFMERQDAMAKLTFERNELSARAAARIRDILGEELVKVIGGLPAPAKQESFFEMEADD